MQINRDNLKWLGRTALILVAVCVIECLVVAFVRKPLPWVTMISALFPLLTVIFVVIPMIKAESITPTA